MFFSDQALAKFREFVAVAGLNQKNPNPEGALDAMPDFRAARAKLTRDQEKDAGQLQQTLREKLHPADYERLCAALNMEPAEDQENEPEPEPAPKPMQRMSGPLMAKIMEFCAPHLTSEDRTELEQLLDGMLHRSEQFNKQSANDQPPPFKGMPTVGGGMVRNDRSPGFTQRPRRAMDAKVANYKLKVLDEQRASFAERYPETARIGGITANVEYRDGTPVTSPPPRRGESTSYAQDSAADASFAARFPDAVRIKVL